MKEGLENLYGEKKKKLMEIFNALSENYLNQSGKYICLVGRTASNYQYSLGYIWLNDSNVNDKVYIFWQGYGQSANEYTLEDLQFILDVIFESKTYEWRLTDISYGELAQVIE